MTDPAPDRELLRKKLDARTRRRLDRDELGEHCEVLLRTEAPPSESERLELDKLGVTTYAQVGNVISARIPSDRLMDLARLDFVRRIEISRDLYQEGRGELEED